jgi:hypothetical protein
MCRSAESAARGRRAGRQAICAALLALTWAGAAAAVDEPKDAEPAVEVGAAASRASVRVAAAGYVLRCWQHGRLLFEEEVAELPDGTARFRLRLNDPQRPVLALLDMTNSLCSVRPTPAAARP